MAAILNAGVKDLRCLAKSINISATNQTMDIPPMIISVGPYETFAKLDSSISHTLQQCDGLINHVRNLRVLF